tara:strand:+ start:359 stop:700 length:342 start_codon:yes stop_codon:yes gene_type:complete
MAITHTQTVSNLQVLNDGTDVVSQVSVKTVSVDDSDPTNLTTETEDNIEVDTSGGNTASGFINYSALTENTILNWTEVKNFLDNSNTKVNAEAWINSVKTPPTPSHVDKALPF